MKHFLTIILLTLTLTKANSQDTVQAPYAVKKMAVMKRLNHELKLTIDQQTQLAELLDERHNKLMLLKEKVGADQKELRKVLNHRTQARLQEILEDWQYDLYLSNKQELKKARDKAHKNRPEPKKDEELEF